jgi:membrane protease YdiL (CAAX protease family)
MNKTILIVLALLILLPLAAGVAAADEPDLGGLDEWFCLTGGLALACPIIWFIIWILIAIWVYRDAEARGKSGVLWLIVVILLGLIGLIVWLVVRPKEVAPPPGMPPPGYPPQYPPQQPPPPQEPPMQPPPQEPPQY